MDMIDAYLEHLRRRSRSGSDKTIIGRRNVLLALDRHLRPHGLATTCQAELEEWLHNDDWSQGTKATYWTCLKSFYTWAADPRDPWITENPTLYMEPVRALPGVARDVDDEELWALLDHDDPWLQLVTRLGSYQGLRAVEISRLDREVVTEQRLFVVKGKGGKPRMNATHELAWEVLADLPPGPVVRKPNGERCSPGYISARFSHLAQVVLGLEGVTLHRLRHWCGVRTQEKYKDVRVTQETLGHVSLSSTQIYTKATLEQQREAKAMLPRPRAA